jgi:hypothetical protein
MLGTSIERPPPMASPRKKHGNDSCFVQPRDSERMSDRHRGARRTDGGSRT